MAKARASVAMDEAEIASFLGDNLKVQVATIGPHGEPHLSTLFYVVDDARIAFWTYGRSQKVVNLRRDPRLSALVEDGTDYDKLRGVSITGHARVLDDYDDVRRIGELVAVAMAGGPEPYAELGSFGADLVSQQAHKRVAIVVEPDHVASWDHRKMG